jgi:hypothetical protein
MDTRTVDNCPDKVRGLRGGGGRARKRGRRPLPLHKTDLSPTRRLSCIPRAPKHHHTQASATTNYVYVAPSDPLASAQFVEIGPL